MRNIEQTAARRPHQSDLSAEEAIRRKSLPYWRLRFKMWSGHRAWDGAVDPADLLSAWGFRIERFGASSARCRELGDGMEITVRAWGGQ